MDGMVDDIQTHFANVEYIGEVKNQKPVNLILTDPSILELNGFKEKILKDISLEKLLKEDLGKYVLEIFCQESNYVREVNLYYSLKDYHEEENEIMKDRKFEVFKRLLRRICYKKGSLQRDNSTSEALGPFFRQTSSSQSLNNYEKDESEDFLELILKLEKEAVKFDTRIYFESENCRENILIILQDYLDNVWRIFLESENFKQYLQYRDYLSKSFKMEDFEKFRVLGRGAFGKVYVVKLRDLNTLYAMKTLNKRHVKFKKSLKYILREKQILSILNSKFTTNLMFSFVDEKNLCLVMDLCTGGSLKFHLHNFKMFNESTAKFFAAEILLGIEHIHSLGYLYRDLKPDNVLLDENGHIKISDMGLVVKLDKAGKSAGAGTAGYWAPESLIKGKSKSYASDIWSWGVCLYQMVVGERPTCLCRSNEGEWCPFGTSDFNEENSEKYPDKLTLNLDKIFSEGKMSENLIDLLSKIFIEDDSKRLNFEEIKCHKFFEDLDWNLLSQKSIEPPFVPDKDTVHADTLATIGTFDEKKFKDIKIEGDEKEYEEFGYTSPLLEKELVAALLRNSSNKGVVDEKEEDAKPCCQIF